MAAQKIIFSNKLGEIEFSNKRPIIINELDGFSELKASMETSKAVKQDGETVDSVTFETRQLVIKFTIMADTIEELFRIRSRVIKIFNPKIKSQLIYDYAGIKRKIECRAESTPAIVLKSNTIACEGDITLLANENPFWEDIYESGELISTWIGGWKFKFKLPFSFKKRGESKKNVYNDGHIETPVEIIFKGPALNPSITNSTTGEFIKVDRELTTDDTLYIKTNFGEKKVEIERNGIRENAFHYIDLDSTFFNLELGDNLIEYRTENDLEPQSVEIRYRNRYIGV
ncbi:phage tail family protein [Clostridium perfringens]|uniref:phage tail family protein n=1 Tax=Clostridium perfringens TaxID=1502 RepID=UPI0028CBDA49|nr:phage tail family protein [Clostridium perfringens]MDT7986925.1 phage tail family protein [Clostridium perfringens]